MRVALDDEAEARERLIGLLTYIKALGARATDGPPPGPSVDAAGQFCVHEAALRRLPPKCVDLGGAGDAWLVLRRPPADGDATGDAAAAAARATYAALFTVRQEALREGRGAQLTVGVGLVRWRREGVAVEHPLVLLPAALELASDGALVVRPADACGAALWPFTGVPDADSISQQLEKCATDYHLVGRGASAAPAPTDRDAWAPLLRRCAHLLGADGEYVDGPPSLSKGSDKHTAAGATPRVHNCLVLFCRDASAGERGVSRDADALADALRKLGPGGLPTALARLAGIYASVPPTRETGGLAWLQSAASFLFGAREAPRVKEPFFGLVSNEQQAAVISTLEREGCAVLVGPPGTGKTHTIANVICHYLATGRRVLVTSKGEAATEVLRQKLPEGIRELCVSLGSGDASSFRRLESAVETLAYKVAAAPRADLAANAKRLKARYDRIQRELDVIDAANAARDSPHFAEAAPPLSSLLGLHADHLALVNVPEASTLAQLAEACSAALVGDERAFFLDGCDVDAAAPPPSEAGLDELRTLRRSASVALRWETSLRSRAARAARADRTTAADVRAAAARLREKADLDDKVARGDLPRLADASVARRLLAALEGARACVSALGDEAWLLSLLRRAGDDETLQRVRAAAWLADKLAGLGGAETHGVFVSEMLLRLAAPPGAPFVAPRSDAGLSAAVVSDTDFYREVAWRAHPERRRIVGSLLRRLGGRSQETLAAELSNVRVFDRAPAGAREWSLVENRLILRGAAARLREACAALQPLVPQAPAGDDETAAFCRDGFARRLCAAAAALQAVAGLGDFARAALATPVASYGELAARGVSALDDEIRKVRASLRALHPDVTQAVDLKAALLAELEAPRNEASVDSPTDELRLATEALGSTALTVDEATQRWQRARLGLQQARAALEDLASLRQKARQELGHSAPAWAKLVSTEAAVDVCPLDARRIWAAVASQNALRKVLFSAGADGADARRLLSQRDAATQALVAAVAQLALREAMSADTSAALVRLVSAVAAAGPATAATATSQRAPRLRLELAEAMKACADAVPCWIMPTFRVSQCLPPTIGSFDLVILDEASQSDATALTALLRGARVLVVGDQKQVSPTAAFVSEASVAGLKVELQATRHPYLEQLLPGRSVFDLAQTCYADARIALTQHFRCVPACISFSNAQFYNHRLEPRRLPPQSQRLDPALVDAPVKGKKQGKVNPAEADALVDYLAKEVRTGAIAQRGASVAVISLLGVEQARLLRKKVLEKLTDAELARHKVIVGDPSSLQGDERDVVLLSLVASPGQAPAQVGRTSEQKFNVALSRARDRMVLFRSLDAADIKNQDDLKARTISFFKAHHRLSDDAAPRLSPFTAHSVEGQLCSWLDAERFSYDSACSLANSCAVVEDTDEDRRLCLCVDGAGSAADHVAAVKEQRVLERGGWLFFRVWTAEWLLDREACQRKILDACAAAGVRPNTAQMAAGAQTAAAAQATTTTTAQLTQQRSAAASSADPIDVDADTTAGDDDVCQIVDAPPNAVRRKRTRAPASDGAVRNAKPRASAAAASAATAVDVDNDAVAIDEAAPPPAQRAAPQRKRAAAAKKPPTAKKPEAKRPKPRRSHDDDDDEDDEWDSESDPSD
ncbi:hypothetical protein M885DRAFT_618863 [Pelagophyceae sp. CCMP2097]|nr:hypothetical protein M885DRAFT_618863 [Pelagophyceae sp. CCMP2097]